jgi:hypothetical protein
LPASVAPICAAFEALGIEPDDAFVDETAGTDETADAKATEPADPVFLAPPAAPARKTRGLAKQAQLIGMLKRPEGAYIEEIAAAFGWQAHSVRGAIAGALKKKLGLAVTSEKIEGRGRVYRIAARI